MNKTMKTRIQRIKAGWYIWLFPLFAAGLTAWLLFDYYEEQGPRVMILFDDAAGLQREKTTVRFRGVSIGTVKDVYISKDQKDVVAEVLLRKDAEHFAVEGSKFSLVTPKVGLQGVSGLNTIFEGVYISVIPGPAKGKTKHEFQAQNMATTTISEDTSAYLLETDNVESVNPGDSITYRGLKIGTVTKLFYTKGAQLVQGQINVDNKYVHLIRENTVFWRKVAVQAKLGLFNSEIKVNSLDSIVNGGIEIATPDSAGSRAKALHKFSLGGAPPKDYAKWKPFLE